MEGGAALKHKTIIIFFSGKRATQLITELHRRAQGDGGCVCVGEIGGEGKMTMETSFAL